MELSSVKLRETLIAAGESRQSSSNTRFVHFIHFGMISHRRVFADGSHISVNHSSSGDLVEIQELMTGQYQLRENLAILPTRVVRVSYLSVRRAFTQNTRFALALGRAMALKCAQVEELSACNALHLLDIRLCRYLLALADRWGHSVLVKQETLAEELGVQRTSTNLVLQNLQDKKLVETSRGTIRILDSERLSQLAQEGTIPRTHIYGRPHPTVGTPIPNSTVSY